eukprot:TRINITY_DN12981_c0_g1_i5.p2 TRINITY_DN12981_c0_g1~~TRINITY_DN12981_c0_g1_i5.p2  ORF type:complete len:196 (-),score=-18.75 TRINITY_DN12981_c0_g1_i5:1085-1672(-)
MMTTSTYLFCCTVYLKLSQKQIKIRHTTRPRIKSQIRVPKIKDDIISKNQYSKVSNIMQMYTIRLRVQYSLQKDQYNIQRNSPKNVSIFKILFEKSTNVQHPNRVQKHLVCFYTLTIVIVKLYCKPEVLVDIYVKKIQQYHTKRAYKVFTNPRPSKMNFRGIKYSNTMLKISTEISTYNFKFYLLIIQNLCLENC